MRLKCIGCDFINFPQDIFCKRCKSRLEHALEYQNVWRDGKRLVMGANPILPRICLKCCTTEHVSRFPLSLTYVPISAYFTLAFRVTYWWDIESYGYLCRDHRNAGLKQTFIVLPDLLIFFGAFALMIGWVSREIVFSLIMFVAGGLMVGLGVYFRKEDSPPLRVAKRSKRHIWVDGVDPDLLAQLEDFADADCDHPALDYVKFKSKKVGL